MGRGSRHRSRLLSSLEPRASTLKPPDSFSVPKTFRNFIAGQWVDSSTGETFDNINPADTSDIVGAFPLSSVEDVNRGRLGQARLRDLARDAGAVAR